MYLIDLHEKLKIYAFFYYIPKYNNINVSKKQSIVKSIHQSL